jgi:hypothetical protein
VLFIVLFQRKDSKQAAWRWALLFGITGAIVCASKLAFMGWGMGIRELDFTGFSGHTALSTFWPISCGYCAHEQHLSFVLLRSSWVMH